MEQEQRKRIEKMENSFNEMSKELQNLETALDQWTDKMSLCDDIVKYYTGEEWRIDIEASNQEDFPTPQELPHGVLAEDTIFNEMIRHREIAIELLKVATKMLEV